MQTSRGLGSAARRKPNTLASMDFLTADFLSAVLAIILIDIVLGGDNAVVIALACRKLPEAQRRMGIIYGTAGAVGLRVILVFFALTLLAIPFLKIVGALLLVWIGVKLLAPGDEDAHGNIEGSDRLWAAVKTVIVADLVMSIDNVIAIAGAAEGAGGEHKMSLVIFGLVVSIPIIVWGSQFVMKLMGRFPIIITAGGMLLGWIAGTIVVVSLVGTAVHLVGRWQATRVTKLLQASLRRAAFTHAVRLPLGRVWQLKSGGLTSLLREDAGGVAELVFSMIYNPFRAIVQLLGILTVLAWTDGRLLLGAVLLLPLVWFSHRTWIGRIRPIQVR